jgi:hypothetical protein
VEQKGAETDEHLGRQRQRAAQFLENLGKAWNHEDHRERHRAQPDCQDDAGIGQGHRDFLAGFLYALVVLAQPLQRFGQLPARLARPHHADVKVRKNLGPLRQRVGKAHALEDVVAQLLDDQVLALFRLAPRQRVQRIAERHAGREEIAHLTREKQHLPQVHLRRAGLARKAELETGFVFAGLGHLGCGRVGLC